MATVSGLSEIPLFFVKNPLTTNRNPGNLLPGQTRMDDEILWSSAGFNVRLAFQDLHCRLENEGFRKKSEKSKRHLT
jgi:hypothetical protein